MRIGRPLSPASMAAVKVIQAGGLFFFTWLLIDKLLFFALYNPANGDEGQYASAIYLYFRGLNPFLDFYYCQGMGLPWVMNSLLFFSEPTLHVFRLFMVACNFVFIGAVLVVVWQVLRSQALGTRLWVLGVVVACFAFSPFYLYRSVYVGTKAAIDIVFVALGCWAMAYGVAHRKMAWIGLAGFFGALVVCIKYTYVMVPLLFFAFLVFRSQDRKRDLLIFSLSALVSVVVIHWSVLSAEGLTLLYENFQFVKRAYALRPISSIIVIDRITSMTVFFTSQYLFVPVACFIVWRSGKVGKFFKGEQAFFGLVFVSGCLYLGGAAVALFKNYTPIHVGHIQPLVTLPVLSAALIVLVGNQKKWQLGILLGIVALNGVLSESYFSRQPFRFADAGGHAYNLLAKNPNVEKLNALSERGYTQYLYIGRFNHHVLPSKLLPYPASVGGTAPMDLHKPDREEANRLMMIASSNMADLIGANDVVAAEYKNLKLKGWWTQVAELLKENQFTLYYQSSNLALYTRPTLKLSVGE